MSTILGKKKIDYSSKANPEQLDAIMTTEGPVLIIAGAGTGKTTTLVNRLTHLIEIGTEPSRILLLTFTNKAADEMTERANKLLKDNYGISIKSSKENDDGLQSGTYHSFCCKLIRRYHKKLGFKKSFTLLDPDDCGQAIEIVMEKEGYSNEDKKYPKGSQLASVFSTAVNKSKSVREVIETEYQDFGPFTTEIEAIYNGYIKYKKEKNILDFDDLLLYAVKLLNENPDVQEEVINRYKYIMVDEYQDSNLVQLDLLKALTDEEHMNVCVVGDPDQAIYAFRGSNYSNIINFPEQFNGCKTIILDRNYRSNTEILDLSNQITDKITNRFKKGLRGLRTKGEKPLLVFCDSSEDEAKYIFSEIMNSHKRGTDFKDMAVLVKGSHDSYTLEALIQQYKDKFDINYQKFGGKKFMDKAFVKDALALVKIIVNPEDSISWFRVLKIIPYIGPAHANKITESIEDYGVEHLISEKNKGKKFATYLPTLYEMIQEVGEKDASEKMDYIVNIMYEKLQRLQINNRRAGTKKTQYESLKELERNVHDLQILVKIASSYNSLEAFLIDLSLDNSKDSSDKDLLTISTVHSAKGLEFKDVYVMQAVNGVYPYESSETVEELDEERRVLYVALTRAKDNLHIMVPSTVMKFGNLLSTTISPFLEEVVDYMKAINISTSC